MVAYSFQGRFVAPIQAGVKQQTIRGKRRRHVKQGETIQLFYGLRTKYCTRIGTATCAGISRITVWLDQARIQAADQEYQNRADLDEFARSDGFRDWPDMLAFWREHHPNLEIFDGFLIRWKDLKADARGGSQ